MKAYLLNPTKWKERPAEADEYLYDCACGYSVACSADCGCEECLSHPVHPLPECPKCGSKTEFLAISNSEIANRLMEGQDPE